MSALSTDVDLMEAVLSDPAAMAEHWAHPNWRVRYAAAVGMGETGNPAWLGTLRAMMGIEAGRDLYGQPQVREFVGGFDDTRAAELLRSTEAVWDVPPTPEQRDDWQCRGRVRQACILAVHRIGQGDAAWRTLLHDVLREPTEDFVVKTAAATALQRIGDDSSLPHLRYALELDEWCLNIEARKALAALGGTA